jgi:hypothetical protein
MKTIFRKTEKSDTESLKKLWLSCFDEDVTAVNLIFDSDLFDGCCAVVDDRIVSALYLVKVRSTAKNHIIFAVRQPMNLSVAKG